jgi:hypothetical protein
MTQSKNAWGGENAKRFAPKYFAPLFTCEDKPYTERLTKFISVEYANNVRDRTANRQGFGSIPAGMAENYGLSYDPKKDY